MSNIIVTNPNIEISNMETYYNDQTLNNSIKLIQTFDTGATDTKTKQITVDEMSKMNTCRVFR